MARRQRWRRREEGRGFGWGEPTANGAQDLPVLLSQLFCQLQLAEEGEDCWVDAGGVRGPREGRRAEAAGREERAREGQWAEAAGREERALAGRWAEECPVRSSEVSRKSEEQTVPCYHVERQSGLS